MIERLALTIAVVAIAAACNDAPNAPERRAHFPDAPAAPTSDREDVTTWIFDYAGHMNVRHNGVMLARGVSLDWRIGDPVPIKSNAQLYNEWYEEPKIGTIPPQPITTPNQETNCYQRMRGVGTYGTMHYAKQSLGWQDMTDRQTRQELATGQFRVYARHHSAGVVGGTQLKCVRVDSATAIRTAWEYMFLSPTAPTFNFANSSAWEWCYGLSTEVGSHKCGSPVKIGVKVRMMWNRYCNYFEAGQYTMTVYGGSYAAPDNTWSQWPTWIVRVEAPMPPAQLANTTVDNWGGEGNTGSAPYGFDPYNPEYLVARQNICTFSSNNNSQRAGWAIWRKDVDAHFAYN